MLPANPKIRIGDRLVGAGHPAYVIAEIGINHDGRLDRALELVDRAAEAGADAAKFQRRDLARCYRPELLRELARFEQGFQYLIPEIQRTTLPDEAYAALKGRCEELGIDFLCTPFDPPSVDFVAGLGVKAFKVASCDLTNFELLEVLGGYGLPLVVSTGMSSAMEIAATVEFLERRDVGFALLHCVATYPTPHRDINLRFLERLAHYGKVIGYSGHEPGTAVPIASIALGAGIIEKHLTDDRDRSGPDHAASLLPGEFADMVAGIRQVEAALGRAERAPTRGEVLNREVLGKALVARRDLRAGEVVRREDVEARSPAVGLSPQRLYELVGTRLGRDLPRHAPFLEGDLATERRSGPVAMPVPWGLIARWPDLDAMAAWGPDVIELRLTERDLELDWKAPEAIDAALVLHAPEYDHDVLVDLCTRDPEVLRRSIAVIEKTAAIARRLAPGFRGEPLMIVHPGAMSRSPLAEPAGLLEALAENLARIDTVGVEIILENLPPHPWYFGGQWATNAFLRAAEIETFCREHGFRICLDICHAWLACEEFGDELAEFCRRLAPFTAHVHISDAAAPAGEGLQIGEGDCDLAAAAEAMAAYEGPWLPEVWQGHREGGRGFLLALERLAPILAASRRAVPAGGAAA